MKFTIDCETDIGMGPSYRLTKSANWREFENWQVIEPQDKAFVNLNAADSEAKSIDEVFVDGHRFEVNPRAGLALGHTEDYARVFVRSHRIVKPKKFTVADVQSVIRHGDDTKQNVVVVEIDGTVKMLDVRAHHGFQRDPHIAVAYSISQPGNGYVGPKAAKDVSLVERVYRGLLEDWIEHLEDGRPNHHDEDRPYADVQTLLKRVVELTAGLK